MSRIQDSREIDQLKEHGAEEHTLGPVFRKIMLQ